MLILRKHELQNYYKKLFKRCIHNFFSKSTYTLCNLQKISLLITETILKNKYERTNKKHQQICAGSNPGKYLNLPFHYSISDNKIQKILNAIDKL